MREARGMGETHTYTDYVELALFWRRNKLMIFRLHPGIQESLQWDSTPVWTAWEPRSLMVHISVQEQEKMDMSGLVQGRQKARRRFFVFFLFVLLDGARSQRTSTWLCSQVQTLTSSGDGLTETPRKSITQDLPFCSDVDITLSSKGACRHLDSRSVPPSPPASSFSLFSFDNQQLSNRMMPTSFKEVGRGLQTPGEDRATPWV